MRTKKTINLILRIIISTLILIFLLKTAGLGKIQHVLVHSDHKLMILGVILYILCQVISSYKWKLLADAIGFKNKMTEYLDYYFVGMFFNLFLPTTVGGDVTKCYYLSQNDDRARRAPAVYSVLADRFSGLAVIVWMCTIAMFTPLGSTVHLCYKLFMLFMSVLIIVLPPFFPNLLMMHFKRKKWARTVLRDIKVYLNNPKLTIEVLLWSFFFHLIVIVIHIIIGKTIGVNIPPLYYFIAYPMSAMAGFIPLAFNGLGPREAAYIIFLGFIGIKQPEAIAFSIIWFVIVFISSLTGILFYIKGKHTPPPDEFEFMPEDEEATEEIFELNENNA